ncbi:MAG: hypothetical protein A2087_02220 [Spirochaetes bacterium GWD1_61_31]|nr:MAG: hypothetical protein A2Y37_00640 [Spirochaetes bacterium GWB1_60_80]OHD29467.1 MAG: hypothetical protein A2004_03685 [Spirochaetes bacterium GWC1_61_12]OHD43987.1 MAG: hypothetical protein A2087_02220 [Spirochaetes bacterium GWD1_61_31]OHD46201.1 MAG: hypothetical protein A2Y35_00885 [Spirochaetes bacterium GWE1_60_18]OHD60739.1 MAG: hypothetical protein A2Y32_07690 [Spirochaetes bacterium GWF1_60_12]HAP43868.1 hypothetical protein [Spirochaetaceae bacterium]
MKKSFWLGLLVLLLVIGGIFAWRFLSAGSTTGNSAGAAAGGAISDDLPIVTPQPLTIGGIGGYSLPSVDLGDGPVPLVRIPLDTWGGYAALFAANGGAAPNRDSVFYRDHHFAVELVREENGQAQLDGFAAGRYTAIWASMDSLPLLYDALHNDRRVVPQVIGLFDWSVGGDGILVRDSIRRPQDLKGKTILTSYAEGYSFFMLWYLAQLDISPLDVRVVHIPDAEKAAEAFRDNPGIAAWVTWTPFLTDAIDPDADGYMPDVRLLINSRDASQLIADVLMARGDLIREKPEIAIGLVDGLLAGADLIAKGDGRAFVAMAAFYGLAGGAAEARELLIEVHLPTLPEMQMFFDPENPIGAYKIFLLAQEYYKMIGSLASTVSYEPDRVLYLAGLEAAAASGRYAGQGNTIQNSFNRDAALNIHDLENQRTVLAADIQLYFEAQRLDFDVEGDNESVRQNMRLLARMAEQMNILGTTLVKLVGHLDTSKVEEFRAQGPQAFIEASAQAKLISKRRAEFVKSVLIDHFGIDPDRIITEGRGWDDPVDADDPQSNRRVEVQFISFE